MTVFQQINDGLSLGIGIVIVIVIVIVIGNARRGLQFKCQFNGRAPMVFGKLLPRGGNFFELFNQRGTHIVKSARSFMLLI